MLHDAFNLHGSSLFAGYGSIVMVSALSYIITVPFVFGAIYTKHIRAWRHPIIAIVVFLDVDISSSTLSHHLLSVLRYA